MLTLASIRESMPPQPCHPSLMSNCKERSPRVGARRIRREQRQVDQFESRARNGVLKTKERARRDARMRATIEKGKLPYTPPVMSWLSVQLGKPSRLITQTDVDRLLK